MSLSCLGQNIIDSLLRTHPNKFKTVLDDLETYELQIVYTVINRDSENRPSFKTYTFGIDESRYFYPASTVKMPTAFMALEKLNQLGIEGLTKDSPIMTYAGRSPQAAVTNDSSSANNLASIEHYIKKIFLVSDNDAFNRLYEFLGQDYLNRKLWDKGFINSAIVHRLSVSGFDQVGNRYTNPVGFYRPDNRQLLYYQGEVLSPELERPNLKGTKRGLGYIGKEGQLVREQMDFTHKNYISLPTLHDMLVRVLFPDMFAPHERFDLSTEDYDFLYHWMSAVPQSSEYPKYDKPDGYVKFLMYGGSAKHIPDNIKIFNKVGDAYGFLTDMAYIIDKEQGVEFLLGATIHVNKNRIYNDNNYEYESIGFPFLRDLGQVFYEYELGRARKHRPDLSRFTKE